MNFPLFVTGMMLLMFSTALSATTSVLLSGIAETSDGASVAFSLNGRSREDVIGGSIVFGDQQFEITNVSDKNLVGAKLSQGEKAHLVLFSSSYSRVTSTGKPWATGTDHHGCDQPYNSFLAVYEVATSDLAELPDPPYWHLGEDASLASGASVYCFLSQPADRG